MKTAIFHVKGLTPMLMHSTKGMSREGAPGVKTKKIPDAKTEAELGTYRDENGDLYIPCIWFRQALVSGGKGRKIGKQFATSLLKGAVIDPDRRASIVDPDSGDLITEYTVDERPVVIGKARVMRARPRFDTWAADIPLDYDDEIITPDIIQEVLNIAGSRIGVGDYRVEKGGWFGRFEVMGYEVVD